ncbi:MAG: hypothetical protein RBS37_03300 [Bacteroidales bacterium]|jgi:hypothetical protein|nr:hypothetical protein [Bacteroidales bacterium]
MKKIILISVVLSVLSMITHAQETGFEYYKGKEIRTLTGRNRQGGVYFGLTTGYTVIDNSHAVLFGGRISWIGNKILGAGIGGTGFINEYHYEPSIDREVFLAGAYGGIYIEPILMPRAPVHLSFPILLGAGGVSYVSNDPDYYDNFIEDSEPFLLIEPSAELELNMSRFFRLAIGASYRFPTAFNIGTTGSEFITASSIKGWSCILSLKFGKF